MALGNPSPTVTLVIPSFNPGRALTQTLQAAVNQTYELCEVIVVDDGSTDGSAELAESFGPPVKVIRQTNQGAAVARHNGCRMAKGQYVAFVDADDSSVPIRKIEYLMRGFKEHPDCVVSFGIAWNLKYEEPRIEEVYQSVQPGATSVVSNAYERMIQEPWPIAPAMNLIARREAAVQCSADRGFFLAANDYDLQLRLAAVGAFVRVAELTARFKYQPGGITDTFGLARQMTYAMISASQSFRAEKRHPREWRTHVENYWPRNLVQMIVRREWNLALRILAIGLRYGRITKAFRPLWWAIDTELKCSRWWRSASPAEVCSKRDASQSRAS